MKYIDMVLMRLRDNDWHELDEIRKTSSMSDKKLFEVMDFLKEQSLITADVERIKITPRGLKFLELPH